MGLHKTYQYLERYDKRLVLVQLGSGELMRTQMTKTESNNYKKWQWITCQGWNKYHKNSTKEEIEKVLLDVIQTRNGLTNKARRLRRIIKTYGGV